MNALIAAVNALIIPKWIQYSSMLVPIFISAYVAFQAWKLDKQNKEFQIHQRKQDEEFQSQMRKREEEFQTLIQNREEKLQLYKEILNIYDIFGNVQNFLYTASGNVARNFSNNIVALNWVTEIQNKGVSISNAINHFDLLIPVEDFEMRSMMQSLSRQYGEFAKLATDYYYSGKSDQVRNNAWGIILNDYGITFNDYFSLSMNWVANERFVKLCDDNSYVGQIELMIKNILSNLERDKFDVHFIKYLRMKWSSDQNDGTG